MEKPHSGNEFLRIILKAPFMWRRINSIGVILDCNDEYASTLEYSKNEIIGKTIFEHVADQDRNSMHDSLKTWFETGEVKDRKLLFKKSNGETFPVVLSATSLFDKRNELIGSNTVIFDLSDKQEKRLKSYKEFLINTKEKLEEIKKEAYNMFDENSRLEFDGIKNMIEKVSISIEKYM